ncbi:hypothetical protein Tco_1252826 [Tanacetum coccineum]
MPQIPSPPLPPILSPLPVSSPPPTSPTYPLGYRAAMIQLRAEALSTSHSPPPHIILSHTKVDTPPLGTPPSGTPPLLPIPLPTSSPSLLLPSADHGADMPEVCLPPRKRLCFAFGPRGLWFCLPLWKENYAGYLERDSVMGSRHLGAEMLEDMPGAPATDDTELGRRMIEDRRAHARTALLMEREARISREAWGDPWTLVILHVQRCSARFFCWPHGLLFFKLLSWPSIAKTVGTQVQFIEALKLLKILQSQMIEFESQQGPTKGPAQPDAPEEAGSSS